MTIRTNWLILPLCGALIASAISMTGCEDAASREYTQVQASLDSAAVHLRKAEYSRVVSELTPITGGAAGQQNARRLLLTDAMRELGLAHLAQAEALEMELARKRSATRVNLDGLLGLEARAAALQTASTDALRADLNARREATDRQIRDLNQKINELSGPINDRRARIEQDIREVERLREQADELFRTAMDRGHADGLASFKQATALRREADQVERRIALVEIELTQDLEPQRDAAAKALDHARATLEDGQTTLGELDGFDRLYRDDVTKLRQAAEELRRKINDDVKAFAARASSEIEPLYDQAVSQFDRAASEASRAGAGPGVLLEARCREALGRAHWSRARGLADHASLLASLVAAGSAAGNVEGHRAQFEAAAAQKREASELATTALEAAIAAVERAGSVQGAEAYRQTLQNAVALLAGREVDLTPPPVEVDFDFDFDGDMPEIDPAMLEAIGGRDMLMAALDQMDFDSVWPMMEASGMVDASMKEQLRAPFTQAVAAVRARVESGEITDAHQLQQALMQEMMRAMGGFGG